MTTEKVEDIRNGVDRCTRCRIGWKKPRSAHKCFNGTKNRCVEVHDRRQSALRTMIMKGRGDIYKVSIIHDSMQCTVRLRIDV